MCCMYYEVLFGFGLVCIHKSFSIRTVDQTVRLCNLCNVMCSVRQKQKGFCMPKVLYVQTNHQIR